MSIVSTKLDVISSTKSDILMCVKTVPKEFVNLLKKEMAARNWGVRKTAQEAGVSHPTISDIVTNEKPPSFDTVMALAKTFAKSPVALLRLSGLLPPEPDVSPQAEEMLNLIGQLGLEDQEELVKIAKMKIDSQTERSQTQTSRIRKSPARVR